MITAEIVSSGRDIAPFQAVWEQLYCASDAEPSSSFEWTSALLKHHVKEGDRVVLLRMSHGGETIALIPLVARPMNVFGVPIVTIAPVSERYNTHSDLLIARLDPETLESFAAALSGLDLQWDVFRLSTVLEDHPLARWMDGRSRLSRLRVHLRHGRASYFLSLPDTYEGYLAGRSAKFRNHLKRAEKRLQAEGDVQVLDIRAPRDVDRGYDMLLEVERSSWKHAHGTAISAVPRQTGFYRDLCHGAAAQNRLHLQLLTVGGDPVAYNLGYVRDNRYYYLKTSYVDAYKRLHVSTCLRATLVKALIESGIREMDFPAEPYEWERQWTEQVRWHKVVSVYRPTLAGRALALAERLRHTFEPPRTIAHVDPRAHRPQ